MAEKHCTKKRWGKRYAYNGEEKTLAEWAEFTGLSYDTFRNRLRNGWTIERAIETPLGVKPSGFHYSKIPEYKTWCGIIQRCENPNNSAYDRYGDRGITICSRWRNSFAAFIEDMGRRPSTKHSIERIDNELGYFSGNCKWATGSEQARNKLNSLVFTIDGETKHLIEWCEEFGMSYTTAKARIRQLGWEPEEAVKAPLNRKKNAKLYRYKGELKTASELAETCDISYGTVKQRLFYGWTIEDALETPIIPPSQKPPHVSKKANRKRKCG